MMLMDELMLISVVKRKDALDILKYLETSDEVIEDKIAPDTRTVIYPDDKFSKSTLTLLKQCVLVKKETKSRAVTITKTGREILDVFNDWNPVDFKFFSQQRVLNFCHAICNGVKYDQAYHSFRKGRKSSLEELYNSERRTLTGKGKDYIAKLKKVRSFLEKELPEPMQERPALTIASSRNEWLLKYLYRLAVNAETRINKGEFDESVYQNIFDLDAICKALMTPKSNVLALLRKMDGVILHIKDYGKIRIKRSFVTTTWEIEKWKFAVLPEALRGKLESRK